MSRIPLDVRCSWAEIFEKVEAKLPEIAAAKGFKRWFFANEKNGFLFDKRLVARCFGMHRDMANKDKDHFLLIVGQEGSGKSTLAVQVGSWVDPDFVVENVCFDLKDYVTRLKIVKPGSLLIFDEGGVNLFSRESMTFNNRTMTKLFMLQRQKNVSVIVCCPSYDDIDKYIRKHRLNTLIRITQQGHYRGYLKKAIKIINKVIQSKKEISQVKIPDGSFWDGTFRKVFPKTIDREAYLKRKIGNLNDFIDNINLESEQLDWEWIPIGKLAIKLSLTNAEIRRKIKQGTIIAKQIGNKWFLSKKEYENLLNP